jgi:hypothetical protein
MYCCILILPFLSFISCAGFGRLIGTSGACFLSTTAIGTAFLMSSFALYETLVLGSVCNIILTT